MATREMVILVRRVWVEEDLGGEGAAPCQLGDVAQYRRANRLCVHEFSRFFDFLELDGLVRLDLVNHRIKNLTHVLCSCSRCYIFRSHSFEIKFVFEQPNSPLVI